jgi:hypothetical protein
MSAVVEWQKEADALYFSLGIEESAELEQSALAWPAVYVNRETKKPYKPHHADEEIFVYSDTPDFALAKGGEGGGKSVAGIIKDLDRLRRGMSGIMGCVAADTVIDGIPIAERTSVDYVETLYGHEIASAGFLKGQADLFRVVTVTAAHRFLTPTGWRQLSRLRVGDVIAADGIEHGQISRGKRQGSLGYYFLDCRPCDGYASPSGLYDQDKLQRLALSDHIAVQDGDYLSHAYTGHFASRLLRDAGDGECPSSLADQEAYYKKCGVLQKGRTEACRLGNPESAHQYRALWHEGSAFGKLFDRFALRLLKRCRLNSQESQLFEQDYRPLYTSEKSYHNQISEDFLLDSCFNYTPKVRWVSIKSIAFQYYGDFYDLTVPFAKHYKAHGLWHHNSSDLPHFKKSLWPEFRRWCPPEIVVSSQRYRLKQEWEPHEMFTLTFTSGAQLICGGFDDPGGWEGPNVSFAHWDEARRHKSPAMLKVLNGRVRIPGPNGEPPQLYLTTTPAKHWLFEYFGPIIEDDPYLEFKRSSLVITLLTIENEQAGNVAVGFTEKRGQGLTESEKRVLLDAEWEDIEDVGRFLDSILLWDACEKPLPPLDAHTPVILAMDAGESNDAFGTLLISRHEQSLLAVRYVRAYVPTPKVALDFDKIESDIRDLCARFAVQQIAYDPFLLGQMMRRLTRGDKPIPVECVPFPQGAARLEADKLLQDMISQRWVVHAGDPDLRKHLDNANAKKDSESRKLRIVKRMQSLKIDLAVCLSMGVARAFDVLFEGSIPSDFSPVSLEQPNIWT